MNVNIKSDLKIFQPCKFTRKLNMHTSRKSISQKAKTTLKKTDGERNRIKIIKYLDDLGLNTSIGFFILTITLCTGSVAILAIYLNQIKHLDLLMQLIKDQPLIYLIGSIDTFIIIILSTIFGLGPQLLVDLKEIKEWPFNKNKIAYAFTIALALPGYFIFRFTYPYFPNYLKPDSTIGLEMSIIFMTLICLLYPTDEWWQLTKTKEAIRTTQSLPIVYKKYWISIGEIIAKLLIIGICGFYSALILFALNESLRMCDLNKYDVIYLPLLTIWYLAYIILNRKLFFERLKETFSPSFARMTIGSLLFSIIPIAFFAQGLIFRYAFIVSGMANGLNKSSWYVADIESIRKDGAHKISGDSIMLGQQSFTSRQISGHTQIKAYMDIKHDKTIVLCPDWLNGKSREFLTCPKFNVDHIRKYQE